MRTLSTLLLAALVVLAAPPRGQVAKVRIPVWLEAEQELSLDDLAATANGEPVELVRLQGPSEDLLLLLVVDLVADLNEIDLARVALKSTVAELPTNVYVGVMRAQDGLRVLQDPTDDRDAVLDALESFTVSGTPGLIETVETASQLADSIVAKSPVRIAICYITDSDIRAYREDFTNPVINYSDRRDLSRRFPEGLVRERLSKLTTKLGSAQAPVFVVHLEYYSDRLNEAYQAGLLQLTASTGGDAVFCRSNSEIPTVIESTLRRISGHYGLDLQISGKEGETVEIALEGPEGMTYRTRVGLRQGRK